MNARARRLTLRVGRDGAVSVTVPPGMRESDVLSFLDRQKDWLEGARARVPAPLPVREGALVPVDGAPRTVVLGRSTGLDGERLLVGTRGEVGPTVERFLKAHARARLVPEAERVATALGRCIRSVTMRDTRSRWGSCSSAGRLSFSWRVAMAPPEVQRYLAIHEACHLAEMNHSHRFWMLVSRHMPDHQIHRQWLRTEGSTLHRYRFGDG